MILLLGWEVDGFKADPGVSPLRVPAGSFL